MCGVFTVIWCGKFLSNIFVILKTLYISISSFFSLLDFLFIFCYFLISSYLFIFLQPSLIHSGLLMVIHWSCMFCSHFLFSLFLSEYFNLCPFSSSPNNLSCIYSSRLMRFSIGFELSLPKIQMDFLSSPIYWISLSYSALSSWFHSSSFV